MQVPYKRIGASLEMLQLRVSCCSRSRASDSPTTRRLYKNLNNFMSLATFAASVSSFCIKFRVKMNIQQLLPVSSRPRLSSPRSFPSQRYLHNEVPRYISPPGRPCTPGPPKVPTQASCGNNGAFLRGRELCGAPLICPKNGRTQCEWRWVTSRLAGPDADGDRCAYCLK